MGRGATGIGGIFIRAEDPESLKRWYVEQLGLTAEQGPIVLRWRELDGDREALTVFGIFPADTDYFGSPRQGGDDQLQGRRPRRPASQASRRRRRGGPEGNRVELWEPAEGS